MSEPKRFLFVIDSLFPLGIFRQMASVVRQLAAGGHEVHLATMEPNPALQPRLGSVGVVTHNIRKTERRDAGQPFRLHQLAESLRPDVIHAWGKSASSLTSLALAIRPRTSHHRDSKFLVSHFWRPEPRPITRQLFDRRFGRSPDQVLVSHDSLVEQLNEHRTWPSLTTDHFKKIPNVALPLPFEKQAAAQNMKRQLNIPSDAFVAATVAPLIARTRIKDLIWATALIDAFRDDVYLLIIGDGPQKWRLQKFAFQAGASHRVRFIDNPNQSCEWFAGADFYWNSHLLEPNPTGVLTAMASEIPVVCTYAKETDEVILPQQTGLATNYGAKDEFARWTKYLIEQSDSTKQLVRQAKQHVTENFRGEDAFAPLLEIYQGRENVPA